MIIFDKLLYRPKNYTVVIVPWAKVYNCNLLYNGRRHTKIISFFIKLFKLFALILKIFIRNKPLLP